MHKCSPFLERALELIRKLTQMLLFPICSLHDANVPFCRPGGPRCGAGSPWSLARSCLESWCANVLACGAVSPGRLPRLAGPAPQASWIPPDSCQGRESRVTWLV